MILLLLLGFLMVVGGCETSIDDNPSGLAGIAQQLPTEALGWSAIGGDDLYDTESIFSYIDGHAEVYLAYGMKACLARRFEGPEGESAIVLDVFEMASAEDAFGVWSHDRAGDSVEVGQDGVVKHGWLSSWQGRYFLSVYAETGTPKAREALLEIGRAAADAVGQTGSRPSLLQSLPSESLVPESVRYLRNPVILRAHLLVDPENHLGIGDSTPAVIGDYQLEAGNARTLLVEYDSEAVAAQALNDFGAGVTATETDDGLLVGSIDSGWIAGGTQGRYLAIVSEADTQELSRFLLNQILNSSIGD
ncbi:MAG: hypothetical protein GY906_10500 [bacterium]|nr:hypothetical protein [bacterium]